MSFKSVCLFSVCWMATTWISSKIIHVPEFASQSETEKYLWLVIVIGALGLQCVASIKLTEWFEQV